MIIDDLGHRRSLCGLSLALVLWVNLAREICVRNPTRSNLFRPAAAVALGMFGATLSLPPVASAFARPGQAAFAICFYDLLAVCAETGLEETGSPSRVAAETAGLGSIRRGNGAVPSGYTGEKSFGYDALVLLRVSHNTVAIKLGASSKGLVGAEYEDFLGKQLGGRTNVSYGGREFDIEVAGGNGMGSTLIEAKLGNYWNDVVSNPQGLAKFQSDIGSRAAVARSQGSTFMVYSNTPIPTNVQSWLTSKEFPSGSCDEPRTFD